MLSTTVIIDYQNVHLTGYQLFGHVLPNHRHYLDPLNFSQTLIATRNNRIRAGFESAALNKVLVFRGLPSNIHDQKAYSRNLMQAANWERDFRVRVTHRPLKYEFVRDKTGRKILDNNGKYLILNKQEKGIDVLCALALVRESKMDELVILASQDTDLIPAIDEAVHLNRAKIETASWYLRGNHNSRELRSDKSLFWNTRLNQVDFDNSLDPTQY